MSRTNLLLAAVAAAALAQQPPVVTPGQVRNAASRIPPALPGAELTPGSRAVVGGLHLAPGTVQVTIGGRAAKVVRVEPEELEAVVPSGLRPGPANVVVSVDGRAAKAVPVMVGAGAPGLLEVTQQGGWLVAKSTGGAAAEFWIGGHRSAVTRKALGGGIDELRARVPALRACGAPVTAVNAAGLPGNTILVDLAEPGKPCPEDPWTAALGHAGRAGLVIVARSYQGDRASDEGAALFTVRGPGSSWPALIPGSCGLYRADEGFDPRGSILAQMTGRVPGEGLDAGARITVAKGGQARTLGMRATGFYTRTLDALPTGPFLEAGRVLIRSMGGRGVGPMAFELAPPPEFTVQWPAAEAPWRVSWTGMGPDRLAVVAVTASDSQNQAMAMALCVAAPEAGGFEFPVWVRKAMPATVSATLSVASVPRAPVTGWRAKGLDRTAAFSAEAHHLTVPVKR